MSWFGAAVGVVAGKGACVLFGTSVLAIPPSTGCSVGDEPNVGPPVVNSCVGAADGNTPGTGVSFASPDVGSPVLDTAEGISLLDSGCVGHSVF